MTGSVLPLSNSRFSLTVAHNQYQLGSSIDKLTDSFGRCPDARGHLQKLVVLNDIKELLPGEKKNGYFLFDVPPSLLKSDFAINIINIPRRLDKAGRVAEVANATVPVNIIREGPSMPSGIGIKPTVDLASGGTATLEQVLPFKDTTFVLVKVVPSNSSFNPDWTKLKTRGITLDLKKYRTMSSGSFGRTYELFFPPVTPAPALVEIFHPDFSGPLIGSPPLPKGQKSKVEENTR